MFLYITHSASPLTSYIATVHSSKLSNWHCYTTLNWTLSLCRFQFFIISSFYTRNLSTTSKFGCHVSPVSSCLWLFLSLFLLFIIFIVLRSTVQVLCRVTLILIDLFLFFSGINLAYVFLGKKKIFRGKVPFLSFHIKWNCYLYDIIDNINFHLLVKVI